MLLLIDNYDSFSYNLYQLVGSVEPDIRVIRNDAMTVEEIEALHPAGIILSPGPGHPEEAGVCIEVVQKLGSKIPILGVCLGHQADAGLDGSSPLFKGCKATEPVARYHSLAAIEDTLPDCLIVTARADDGEIMAVQHREYPVYGVQFHPESIMTPAGKIMLQNFYHITNGGHLND